MKAYKANVTVLAEQFLPPLLIPKGVFNVYELAQGIFTGEIWTITDERITVRPHQWIVQEENNPERYYAISDKDFRRWFKADYSGLG